MADRSSRPPPQSPPGSAETALIQGSGRTRLRPAQTSAFPIYWNAHHQLIPLSGPLQAATDPLSMPSEYAGLIV